MYDSVINMGLLYSRMIALRVGLMCILPHPNPKPDPKLTSASLGEIVDTQ